MSNVAAVAPGTHAYRLTAAHSASHSAQRAGRSEQRASRSAARPALPQARLHAVSTSRPATDADTSSTSTPSPAAAQRVARRAASLQHAVSASHRFEKSLASQQWVLPTSGFHISVWFGEAGPYWATGYHTGIDFATACGTPDIAVADATVAQTGWDGPYGNQIRLQFENGDQIWYNHLSAIEVSTGQSVRKGEQIGRVGETGNAFGCHTHIEYRLASDLHTAVDPLPFFESHGIHLR